MNLGDCTVEDSLPLNIGVSSEDPPNRFCTACMPETVGMLVNSPGTVSFEMAPFRWGTELELSVVGIAWYVDWKLGDISVIPPP